MSLLHLLLLKLLLLLLSLFNAECGRSPAMFVFGDSLIDNGNNNFIPSMAKANFEPYGIDFGMPTGRFCNGFTSNDFSAKLLGLPFPVAYLSLASSTLNILGGVNYASAAGGILDETGKNYGARISMNGQIALFEKTVKFELPSLIQNPVALTKFITDSLFMINIGSNDYLNNYLMPNMYSSSRTYSVHAFADLLISNLAQQLTRLYKIGARKMVLVGVGPLGCIPNQLSLANSTDGKCIDRVNYNVSTFNSRLKPLMMRLNATLPGSFFVCHNNYDTFMDIIQNPAKFGFSVVNQACCGNGKYGGTTSCMPLQHPCTARDKFVFWDAFHPTQAVNAIIAERCYAASSSDCYPISLYQLAQI